jgi:hypothetical protein
MPGGMGYLSYVYPPRDPLPAGEYCAQHNPTALPSQQVHLIVHCSRLPHVVQLVCDSRQYVFVRIGGSAMLRRHSRRDAYKYRRHSRGAAGRSNRHRASGEHLLDCLVDVYSYRSLIHM